MNLISPSFIKELLAKHNLKPITFLGQNFLVHQPTLNKIIEAAHLQPDDTVLEIGPGLGTLTQELAKKVKKVIAVEKDRGMLQILQETTGEYKNVEIIPGDILEIFPGLPQRLVPLRGISRRDDNDELNYKVVANVPYYITSPIIRMFLEAQNPPTDIILMIQKEVAQRICAKPGEMSILAVSVQFYASAKIVAKIPKEHFWPKPKVDSAIISIIPNATKPTVAADDFFKIVKAGFIQPRKQLGNNFSKTLKKTPQEVTQWLAKNHIKPEQRAETLSIEDWIRLTESYQQLEMPPKT